MKRNFFCLSLVILFSIFSVKNSLADFSSWSEKLSALKTEMPRLQAEKIIADSRGVKSTYNLTSLDTSRFVIYKLDNEYVLVVRYQPGSPRPLISELDGSTSHGKALESIDGKVLDWEIRPHP